MFSVMMLAWPNAEMFKGGIAKLGPTIQLWTSCLTDVDHWTAQRAAVLLCKECRFPPTIADFREKVDKLNRDIRGQISSAIQHIRSAESMYGSLEAFYGQLPEDSRTRKVIAALGGPQSLVLTSKCKGRVLAMWNWDGFSDTYKRLLRQEWSLENPPRRTAIGGMREKGS